MAHAETVKRHDNDKKQGHDVKQTGEEAQRLQTPTCGDTPERPVPETLGEKKQHQDAQNDGAAQDEKSPIHVVLALSCTYQFSMPGPREFFMTRARFLRMMKPRRGDRP